MNAIDDGSLSPIDLAIINQTHLTDAAQEVLSNSPSSPDPGSGDAGDLVSRDYGSASDGPVPLAD